MGITGRRYVRNPKKFTFAQQIEKFSWQLHGDAYTSPKYYCESNDCSWILIIEPVREPYFTSLDLPPYSDYIRINLRRSDFKKEYQLADVHLVIVDSFNICPFYASKKISFTPSFNEDVVLRVRRKDLFHGYWGLNELRFIPSDVLTVKCEIVTYEIEEKKPTDEDELEYAAKYEVIDVFVNLFRVLFFALMAYSIFYNIPNSDVRLYLGYILLLLIIVSWFVLWLFFTILPSLVGVLWYFIMPGGDRTYNEPQNLVDNKTKNLNNRLKDCFKTENSSAELLNTIQNTEM